MSGKRAEGPGDGLPGGSGKRGIPAVAPTTTLSSAKEEAIDVLAECFAQDLMPVEDFERRVSIVHAAASMSELSEAVEGIRTRGAGAPQGEQRAQVESLQRMRPDVPAGRVRQSDRAIAVLGSTKRVGNWVPARRNTAVSLLGSTVLDLREALLGPGECTFSVAAFLGEVEIIVPPGLYVECAGSAVLGSFGEELRRDQQAALDPDAPRVRIEGIAVLGSVEIEYRRSGESKKQARRRLRTETKENKRLGKIEKRESRRRLRREAKENKRLSRIVKREARRRLK